jgi:hypothetical protein
LSRISDKLGKLHRTSAPLGFGFGSRETPERRMLLVASFDGMPDADAIRAVSEVADALVLREMDRSSGQSAARIPAGCWLARDAALPDGLSSEWCDFVVCEVDGPAAILAVEGLGWVAVVTPGAEASHLRAVAEIGAEAVLVSADNINLARLSTYVELRRVRMLCNRPLFVCVDTALDGDRLVSLSRAGIDALVVRGDDGIATLQELRQTLESVASRMRKSRRDEAVSIVGHVVGSSHDDVPDEEGEEEEEDDD